MGIFTPNNFYVLALAFISGLATLFGVILGEKSKKSCVNICLGTSFAAGIMLLISFFELIPNSYSEIADQTPYWVICGFLIILFINKVLPHIHTVKAIEDCDQKCSARLSYLLLIGLILHDFPEGFAIPSSFLSSAGLGLLLVTATFIHNIPEGYVLTVASAKFKSKRFFYKSALFSATSTMLGAVLGIVLIHWFGFLNPIFLSLAAGAMIYISLHELIPYSLRIHNKITFLTGATVSVAVYLLLNFFFHV